MRRHGFMGQSMGPAASPFAPPIRQTKQPRMGAQGWISIPYPTMVFWVRNRHIAPYSDVPFIPAEDVKTQEGLEAFGGV